MFLLGESAPWGIRRVWERFLFDGGKGREILRGACLEAGSAGGSLYRAHFPGLGRGLRGAFGGDQRHS